VQRRVLIYVLLINFTLFLGEIITGFFTGAEVNI